MTGNNKSAPAAGFTAGNTTCGMCLLVLLLSFASLNGCGGGGTSAPPGPQVTGVTANTVTLSWNPGGGSSITGYKIFYGTAPGAYSQTDVIGSVTSYTVSGLEPKTTYYFAVTAFNNIGESGISNEVSATTP